MLQTVVESVRRKAWDCDLDATRAHYESQFDEVDDELEALGRQAAGEAYSWVGGTSCYAFGGRALYFYGLPGPAPPT